MKRTNFYFPDQMIARLKQARKHTGLTLSEMIRRAVDDYLKVLGI